MEITVYKTNEVGKTIYKTDEKSKRTKEVIGKFEPKGIKLPIRKKLKILLLKSGIGSGNVDWDIYQAYMDLIQVSADYSDEMLEEYPDATIDMILSQTYLAWEPTEKK